MSLRDATAPAVPALSQDDISSFLIWDVLNGGGVVQAYLQNPQIKPDGIIADWNGRKILVWVDASSNEHFIDVTGDTSFIQSVNAPPYTSPNYPPGSCNWQIAGVCLDPLVDLVKYAGLALVAWLAWDFTRKD